MGKSLQPVFFALAGLIAVALLAIAADMVLLAPIRAADTALTELTTQLSDIRTRLAAAQVELQREQREEEETEGSGLHVFSTPDATTSAAIVQERLRTFLATTGGTLLSSEASSNTAAEGIDRVQVVFRARVTEDGALAVLQWLEAERPRILVDALELQPSPVLDGQPPLEFAGSLAAFHIDAN